MPLSIIDIKMFAQIEGALESVTPEDLAQVEGGNPLPENVHILGQMPVALKALLHLRARSTEAVNDFHSDATQKIAEMSPDEYMAAVTKLGELSLSMGRFNKLFWDALATEFAQEARGHRLHYGPNFEVYIDRSNSPSAAPDNLMLVIYDNSR